MALKKSELYSSLWSSCDELRGGMPMSCRATVWVLIAGALLLGPAPASAQGYFVGYGGGNWTRVADVTISQPALGTSIEFQDVEFDAKPLQSPQYYGWRLGLLRGARGIGVELEFIHLKVIGRTTATYVANGQVAGVPVTSPVRMDTIVQRYSMTHGLNFVLVNVVSRTSLGNGRVALISRAGAGPTVPHTETTVGGLHTDQYEFGGLGLHAATGLDLRLKRRLSAVVEYKLTYARPEITIASGTGQTSALTSQVAVGLAFGLSR